MFVDIPDCFCIVLRDCGCVEETGGMRAGKRAQMRMKMKKGANSPLSCCCHKHALHSKIPSGDTQAAKLSEIPLAARKVIG